MNSEFVGLTFFQRYAILILETVPLFASGVLIGACSPIGVARFLTQAEPPRMTRNDIVGVAAVGGSVFCYIKERQPKGSATGEKHPNTTNELPFTDSILECIPSVN